MEGRNVVFPALLLLLRVTPSQLNFPLSFKSSWTVHQDVDDAYDRSKARFLLEICNGLGLTPAQENGGNWVIQMAAPWGSCILSPCWLEPSDCQVSWPSVGGSKNGHRFSFLYPCSWVVPSHIDFELEREICFTQDPIHRNQKLEKCLCSGASPLFLYLEPRDYDVCRGMSDHVEEKQDTLSSQPGNDCRAMSESLRTSVLPRTDWEGSARACPDCWLAESWAKQIIIWRRGVGGALIFRVVGT